MQRLPENWETVKNQILEQLESDERRYSGMYLESIVNKNFGVAMAAKNNMNILQHVLKTAEGMSDENLFKFFFS
jgi:hypothetical protein